MSYIEERIKYLAAKAWQSHKTFNEMTCDVKGCDAVYSLTPVMYDNKVAGKKFRMECPDCGECQYTIPDAVIDWFLEGVMSYL